MASDILLIDTADRVRTVTLNRPESRNALSSALRTRFFAALAEAEADDDVDVVIVTGADPVFCAGLDLKELGQTGLPGEESGGLDLQAAIENVGKPLIGAINGFAVTGGFEIALMCDILIASEQAKFADTHTRIGVVPGWGLTQRLARLVGVSRAKELSFGAAYLDAETAASWGLVNRVLSAEDLLPHCLQLAREIQAADRATLQAVQHLIDYTVDHGLAEGLAEETRVSRAHAENVSASSLEGRRGQVIDAGRQKN